jgi:putative transposase
MCPLLAEFEVPGDIQFIFAVENRISLIMPEWKDVLYKYITGIVQNNRHKMIVINGTGNHIHIFIGYKPHQLLPDLLQDIKGEIEMDK